MQARVQRVKNTPGSADAEVQLQMAVAVPGQGGDAVAELQLECIQRIGNLARAHSHLFVGVAMDIAFHPARDDFPLAMVAFCKLDQAGDE